MAQPAGGAAPAPAGEDGGFLWNALSSVGRLMLMYYGMQWLKGTFSGQTQTQPQTQTHTDIPAGSDGTLPSAVAKPPQYLPLWTEKGALLDLHVYFSPDDEFDSFADTSKLIWKQEDIAFGDVKDMRYEELTIKLSPEIRNNGSLYAHMYLTHKGHSPNPIAETYVDEKTLHYKKLLTRYQKKQKIIIKKNLVAGKKSDEPEPVKEIDDSKWLSYWWNNLTISLIGDVAPISSTTPPLILNHIDLADDGIHYYPIFYADDFWLLSEQLQPINETLMSVNLTLKWEPKSFWYFQLLTTMEDSFNQQMSMMGSDRKETDQMKRMFSDTNPILLAVTFAVSMLHSLFDFLAFKNDITFWKDKKNMEGMSFRTIVLNVAFQFIIFLYLLDNETSWMIVISNGVGLLIEAWKINKTVNVAIKDTFPYFELTDKYKPSKLTKKTRKYDEMAFQYLAYILYPCLAGYTIYSAIYEEHKGWYSFIIGTLVGFVYMFGFISMTPQLFINYKLKSVAHMPWKTFMYKALNTFIDDLFAFVIKMPWLHRIACLRDDFVFFIYLYQRWIYVEDKRRRNEFGQVGDPDAANDSDFDESDDEEGEAKKKDGKEITKKESNASAQIQRRVKSTNNNNNEDEFEKVERDEDDEPKKVLEKSKKSKKEIKKTK